MCLLQAIAIEEMINAAEKADSVENFDVIMEEQNEEDDNDNDEPSG